MRKDKFVNFIDNPELYKLSTLAKKVGNQVVHEAQEENRKLGIPNTYSFNGKIYFEMPDGTITTESPWDSIKLKK